MRKITKPTQPIEVPVSTALDVRPTDLHIERATSRTPGLVRLKQEARKQALALGHALGRFKTETPAGHRVGYSLAFCTSCHRAVAVSPERYGAQRFGGGAALRESCPNPVAPSALDVESDGDGDDEDVAAA